MNMPHLHMMLVHLPIVGVPVGAFLLGFGLWLNKVDLKKAGLITIFAFALFGVGAYLTGGEAEETVEKLSGVVKHDIHEHEESAEVTFVTLDVVGILALIGLFLQNRNESLARKVLPLTCVGAVVVSWMLAWTANLGGAIRHPEIKAIAEQGGQAEDNDDD